MKKLSQPETHETNSQSASHIKRNLIFEDREKSYFESDMPEYIIRQFKTEKEEKRSKKPTVATLKNEISCYLFNYLEGFHIPTYFFSKISDSEMLIKKTEPLPICMRVFNYSSTQFGKRFGVKFGTPMKFPIFEHFLRISDRNLQLINEYHLSGLGILTLEEYKFINILASKTNAVLRSLCERRGLMLIEMQLEFSRFKEQICLAGEMCPPALLLCDKKYQDKKLRDSFDEDNLNADEFLADLLNKILIKA